MESPLPLKSLIWISFDKFHIFYMYWLQFSLAPESGEPHNIMVGQIIWPAVTEVELLCGSNMHILTNTQTSLCVCVRL